MKEFLFLTFNHKKINVYKGYVRIFYRNCLYEMFKVHIKTKLFQPTIYTESKRLFNPIRLDLLSNTDCNILIITLYIHLF